MSLFYYHFIFCFLGKSFGDGITFLNPKLVSFLVTSQLMGGVLVINTLTLSLGVVGSFVTDMDLKRLDAFLVAPVQTVQNNPKLLFSSSDCNPGGFSL